MRVGYGNDFHRLREGRKLVIGGVTIPFHKGEEGHSDGDVLLHACIDALLGAAALGDIGAHFPPDDPEWKGISSRILLNKTVEKVCSLGYSIGNIDSTVVLEVPKLRPYIDEIRSLLASDLGLDISKVSVKAKTAEGFGPVGEGKGIEAHAICHLYSRTAGN